MKEIIICDIIGVKSGMHYYHRSIYNLLVESNIELKIFSNYSDDISKKYFPNIFTGNIFFKLVKLIVSVIKILKLLICAKNKLIIYLTFGTILDFIFIYLLTFRSNTIIDIHEITILDNKIKSKENLFKFIYKRRVKKTIIHSDKILIYLKNVKYSGEVIQVPHFKYDINKEFDYNKLGVDIVKIKFNKKCPVLLFFGNIRESKGIDDLLTWIQFRSDSQKNDLNFRILIAGEDIFNIITVNKYEGNNNLIFILRHINDDEMKYLFLNSSYILLPYRTITQSGVLEMAYHFRKPIITSNIDYFLNILNLYPSFGHLVDFTNSSQISEKLESILSCNQKYYIVSDVDKYSQRNEFKTFVEKIIQLL